MSTRASISVMICLSDNQGQMGQWNGRQKQESPCYKIMVAEGYLLQMSIISQMEIQGYVPPLFASEILS
jgi:hypothetical protein